MGRAHIHQLGIRTSRATCPKVVAVGARHNNRRMALVILAKVVGIRSPTETCRTLGEEALRVEAGPDSRD